MVQYEEQHGLVCNLWAKSLTPQMYTMNLNPEYQN